MQHVEGVSVEKWAGRNVTTCRYWKHLNSVPRSAALRVDMILRTIHRTIDVLRTPNIKSTGADSLQEVMAHFNLRNNIREMRINWRA